MCAIAGIFHTVGHEPVDVRLLRLMTCALAHRGPDGDGFHVEAHVGLGHRRLVVIDPEGGHQPMFNEDRSAAIVFNGEIYNATALRDELVALGHVFTSDHSDTEVIIHAWESWGTDCLSRLDGMFAFAIWDRNRGELFLARDRLGKKPLYYALDARGRLLFGSEVAAFGVVRDLPRDLDPTAVEDFLAFGYVPEPRSIFAAIKRLPPAHFLLLSRHRTQQGPHRYWHPPLSPFGGSEQDAHEEVLRRLREATAKRMVADVPLGAFLSGGVDSSAVVAMAAGLRDDPLHTFTIAFDGHEDETPFAAQVSARYRTHAHVERAELLDPVDAARGQAFVFGEPFGDVSAAPSFQVCRHARVHATVALSGDGGDEAFGGYRRYRWHALVEAARKYLPASFRHHAVGVLAQLYPKLDRAPRWLRAKHTLTELSLDSALGYARTVTRMQRDHRRALLAAPLRSALDGYSPEGRITALMAECDSDDALLQAQYVDLHTWLPGDILTKMDRTSMAHGLEVRSPFLDPSLFAWGMSLPPRMKLRGGSGKHILKRALEPLLPRSVLYRPKQGFATSPAQAFRARAQDVRTRLLGPVMQDSKVFDMAAVARRVDEHEAGVFDHSTLLWMLLSFEGFVATEEAGPTRMTVPQAA